MAQPVRPAIRERLDGLDWEVLGESILERGHALTAPLLEPAECMALAALYPEDRRFRKRIAMRRCLRATFSPHNPIASTPVSFD